MKTRTTVFLLIAFIATGCASQSGQRTTAQRLAGQVSRMQTDLAEMAESRTKIAIARHHIAERLLASALQTELVNAERLDAMDAAPKKRLNDALAAAETAKTRKAKMEQELAAAEAIAKAETSHINTHTEDFAAAAKLLGRLAEKQNWKEQLSFYFHFFNEVKDSLDEMSDAAKASEAAAESQAVAQAPARPATPPATTTTTN